MKCVKVLEKGLKNINIAYDNEKIEKIVKYYKMIIEWNKNINLTTIVDEEEFINKHILDSLLLAKHVNFNKIGNIIDVGTGAGFPGIPIKIFYGNISVTLLDSLKKRVLFLEKAADYLELKDVFTIHGRAEDYGQNIEYREKFDLCVSRAVSNLSVLSEYCIPFIKNGGTFIAYKSSNVDNEIKSSGDAILKLGGKVVSVEKTILPNTDIERTFIIIKKDVSTSSIYPRKAGTPLKNPL